MGGKVVVFSQEKFDDVIDEVFPLLQQHHKETSFYEDIPMQVNQRTYSALCKAGCLKIYTYRLKGVLVGYSVYTMMKSLRRKDCLEASQNVLFIHPAKRGFGEDFLRYCDDRLKEEGVKIVFQKVTNKLDFSPMLKRMGYQEIEHTYGRRLDHG